MFVPFTPGSELAKRLRENEEKMTKFSKHKIKIVERAGVQLQNLLTRSNPWKGHDCTRDNCLLCFTKNKTEKNMTQECHKRNIVYETRCLTCEQLEQDRIDQLEITEQEKTNKKKETKQYKYIGETSRSAFERGWEHMNDMAQLKSGSHMLKHVVDKHQEQDMAEIQFGMRILKHCKTSFERQVYESVIIQNERQEHFLLNSRSEFNRCSLPRLCTSVGEGEYKNYSKELEQEKQEEDRLEARIRALRKERNKARLHPTREPDNLKKRRKVENGNYIKIQELWGEPEQARPNKNKGEELHDRLNKKPREQSPRPARGSPSPGKTPRDEKDKNKQENEHRSYDGPTDWDNQIEKHTQEMYREQEKKEQEHQNEEQQKETCWELHNLCRDFLEENSKEWARLKEKRTNEKNRVLRLEQAGILSRKAKMKALENNVKLGLSKIPAKDRKEIEREQERVREQELRTVREDLWTLRGREKKVVENKTLKRIQELKKTTEQVVEILTREREKKQREQEIREQQEKIKATRLEKKREREKKILQLQEKWAMLRWINEYIGENKVTWEKNRKLREQERKERLDNWEKNSRFEKIKILKDKFWKKQQEKNENNDPKIAVKSTKNWSVWRSTITPEQEVQNIAQVQSNTEPEVQLAPIFKKIMNQAKLRVQKTMDTETSSTVVSRNQFPSTDIRFKQTQKVQNTPINAEPVPETPNTSTIEDKRVQEQMPSETMTKSKKDGPVQETTSTSTVEDHEVQKVTSRKTSTTENRKLCPLSTTNSRTISGPVQQTSSTSTKQDHEVQKELPTKKSTRKKRKTEEEKKTELAKMKQYWKDLAKKSENVRSAAEMPSSNFLDKQTVTHVDLSRDKPQVVTWAKPNPKT